MLCEVTSAVGDGLHGTPQYDSLGTYFFINGNNLANRKIIIKEETKRISNAEYIKYRKPLNESTILVSINGTIGNVGTYNGENVILGKSACYFNLLPFISKDYICNIIESDYFRKYALKSATGSTIKNVPLKAINNFYIPMPPLQEQKRIVESIEHWLSLVDYIEENKENLQETIKQTKSKILDLAIHGKLVPQDPTDEPACELLKRINPNAEITCDNPQYGKLPNGWCETTFKGIFKDVSSKPFQILQSQIKAKGKHPVISQSSNFIEGYSDENVVYECDCPIVIFGDHTRNVKYVDFDFIVGADGVKIIKPYIDAKYSYYMLVYAASHIVNKGYSRHSNQISKFGYIVPPLAEQHRIVAKIEELFGQLDKIEVSL